MSTEQVNAVTTLLRSALGEDLLGAYLYGSAVEGGLKPASDLDVLVVTARRTTARQRGALVAGLRPISSRYARPPTWRPVELTIVARPDVVPWRYPPRPDFQSGEWLRAEFDAGDRRPWQTPSPDLAILLAQVRQTSLPLLGPPAAEFMPEVPPADVARAMTDELGSLLEDLDTDTANVLLTLARIWHTVVTGEFAPKDVAASWAVVRLGEPLQALERARETYLAGTHESWDVPIATASVTAAALVRSIHRAALPK
jgi:streptomycin 3"-adenylyltransferase